MAYPERSKLQYVIGKLTNPKRNSDTLLENHVGVIRGFSNHLGLPLIPF